jgi:hypothetical protein
MTGISDYSFDSLSLRGGVTEGFGRASFGEYDGVCWTPIVGVQHFGGCAPDHGHDRLVDSALKTEDKDPHD